MKALMAIWFAILQFFSYSDGGTLPEDPAQIPQIMLVTIHSNYAWGISQNVMVIDRDGNCYSHYTDNSNYDYNYANLPDGWVDPSENGWYEKLLEIAENGEPEGTLPENATGYIRQNAANFEGWGSAPVKKYDFYTCDYGVRTLYGVYLNDSGEPCLARLACVGDLTECADSASAARFVNDTGLLDLDGFRF